MTKEEAIESNEEGMGRESYHLLEESNDFKEKQCYSLGVTKTVECKCGSSKWLAGVDDHLTVLKCSECGNEFIIHDG